MLNQTHPTDVSDEKKIEHLRSAQKNAELLFQRVEIDGIIRPGITEGQLNQAVYDLAQQMFGISRYWHKRIVRAGANTLLPYAENPPDHLLREDEILFLDLGPVFEEYEADFGRTFVLGNDSAKLKLRDDVARAFADGKKYWKEHPDLTASQFYAYAVSLAEYYGWEFGGPIAGHLIGHFPHERIAQDKITLYIHPQSHLPMRSTDEQGHHRHWILEIHFIDRQKQIGGFFEELLTID